MILIDADALEEALTEHFKTGRYNNHTVLGYIHAAPTVRREGWVSVPIDTVRDAERYLWLLSEPSDTWITVANIPDNETDAYIDKAMLAASPTDKE